MESGVLFIAYGDTITLEIDGREIDIEVETVPDVYENYLRKQG